MNSQTNSVETKATATSKTLDIFVQLTEMSGSQAAEFIGLTLDNTADLDGKISRFMEAVQQADCPSARFDELQQACEALGQNEIKTAIAVCNYILDKPVESINRTLMEESPTIQTLYELRKVMTDLDPKGHDFSGVGKLLGGFSVKKRLQAYLSEYEHAEATLNSIFERLHVDKTAMVRENTGLGKEKNNLWRLMQLLYQYAYVAEQLIELLKSEMQQSSQGKAAAIESHLITMIQRRQDDIYRQLRLSIIGYVLLEMIRANHTELSTALDRIIVDAVAAINGAAQVEAEVLGESQLAESVTMWQRLSKQSLGTTMQHLQHQAAEQGTEMEVLALLNVASEAFFVEMKALWDYKWHALGEMQLGVVSFVEAADNTLNHLAESYGEDWYGLMTELGDKEVNTLINRAVHIL